MISNDLFISLIVLLIVFLSFLLLRLSCKGATFESLCLVFISVFLLIIFVTWNEVSIAECKKKEVEEIRFYRIRNVKEAGMVKQYIMIDDNYVDVHKLINAYAIDGYGIKRKIFKKVFHGIKYNPKDEFLVAKR